MKLTLTLDNGEVWASWDIKQGEPDPADFDIDGPIEDTVFYTDEIKRCRDPLSDVKDEILRADKYRPGE